MPCELIGRQEATNEWSRWLDEATGRYYYSHHETGKVQWEIPASFLREEERDSASSSISSAEVDDESWMEMQEKQRIEWQHLADSEPFVFVLEPQYNIPLSTDGRFEAIIETIPSSPPSRQQSQRNSWRQREDVRESTTMSSRRRRARSRSREAAKRIQKDDETKSRAPYRKATALLNAARHCAAAQTTTIGTSSIHHNCQRG